MMERVRTGLALAPAVGVATLWSPPWLFAALLLGVLLLALSEWRRLGDAPPAWLGFWTLNVMAVGCAAALFLMPQLLPLLCLAGAVFWAYQGVGLVFPRSTLGAPGTPKKLGAMPQGAILQGGILQGGMIMLFAWCALVWMHRTHGAVITIAMVVVVWSADVFAYFVGKAWGRRKLAPTISPGKTIEGVLGGLVGAGGVALVLSVTPGILSGAPGVAASAETSALWVGIALVAALFSVVGDLFESRLKRAAGVKDSGSLLPGHGGMLDRIDGLVAAVPIFAAAWWSIGWLRG